jgi:hypothetical protein
MPLRPRGVAAVPPARRIIALAALAAVLGCHGKSKSEAPDAPGGNQGQTGQSGVRLRTGVAPMLVADSAGIQQYLRTVDTVRGATFNVTWNPNTVRLTRDQTLQALRRVSRDGATFTFASGEPAIAALKPGQILLVWGIALRKVTAVEPRGAGTLVRTDVVSLPEAIPNGHIAWKAAADFGQGIVSPSVPPPDTITKHASGAPPAAGLFRFASWRQGEGQSAQNPEEGAQTEDEGGAEMELPHHAEGEFGGYEYEAGYASTGSGLDFQLEARKGSGGLFEEPQDKLGERTRAHGTKHVGENGGFTGEEHGAALTGEEKKQKKEHEEQEENTKNGVGKPETPKNILTPAGLFGLANELLDLRVKVRGHLDGFNSEGDIATADSHLGGFKARVEKLNGTADMDWIARLGEQQGVFSERVKLEIPFNYDIPLIIGGLPFMIEIGANLLVTPGLTSHHASAAGSFHMTFDGSAGISATGTDVKTESSLTGTVEPGQRQVMSLGVSAVLVAAQVPRIGFGFGLLNTSAVAYVDHVIATSVVTAGAMGLIPCRRYQINDTFGAGIGVQILGIPVPGASSKHTLGTPYEKVETEPEGFNCKV